jgi:hypothetical protein
VDGATMGRVEGFGRNAPLLEPPSEMRPTGARERLSGRDGPRAAGAWRLADGTAPHSPDPGRCD